jgi:hypothetical protein
MDKINFDDDLPAMASVDASKPNIARVYDYFLDGKDNFAADREEARRMIEVYPELRNRARENRLFLSRAVSWLADSGVWQFLDIGSGLPTARNTHQVAQAVEPACRVVYVDNDPIVVTHAKALLKGENVAAIQGDAAAPADIMEHPSILNLIDPHEPVALILAMVLHFFDADTARDITAAYVVSIQVALAT